MHEAGLTVYNRSICSRKRMQVLKNFDTVFKQSFLKLWLYFKPSKI